MDRKRKPSFHRFEGAMVSLNIRRKVWQKDLTVEEERLKTPEEGPTKLTLTELNGLREYLFVRMRRGHDQ